jgi:hypothetical protein
MNAVLKALLAFALLSLPALTLAGQTGMDCTRPAISDEQRITHPVQLSLAGHTRHSRSG